MAHHSPSPTGGGSSRRLSELLGEQQEPFYLDLYLLEKGCSPAFLDAAACGGGACSTCWPSARRSSGGGRLLTTARSKKKGLRRSGGVLRLLLSKILTGTTAAKKKRRQQQLAAIDWRCADVDEKQSSPGCSTSSPAASPPRALESQEMEVEEEHEEEESKKQLSPVSVLEQRLFEHNSPPPPHGQRALVLFSELLESAYAPSTLLHLLANAKQYSTSVTSKSRDDGRRGAASTARKNNNKKRSGSQHGRRGDDATPFERDLARATALVASEMAAGGGARVRREDVAAEWEDVGADIAAAVLEALTEEAAAELLAMGTMDHHGCTCG